MKTTVTICKILLVIMTVILLISFLLPVYVEKTSNTNSTSSSSSTTNKVDSIKFYQSFEFDFGILQILIPILATILLFAKNKNSTNISYGLYVASFFSNVIYACVLSDKLTSYRTMRETYQLGFGYYIMLIISIVILLLVLILITLEIYQKAVIEKSKEKESNPDTFRKQVLALNSLKEQNLLTEDEYQKKRAEILENLKV